MADGGPEPYGIGMTASTLDALPAVGAPATRALNAAGYTTLRGLAGVSRAELSKLHGVGPEALRIIEEALQEHGLALTWRPFLTECPAMAPCCPPGSAGDLKPELRDVDAREGDIIAGAGEGVPSPCPATCAGSRCPGRLLGDILSARMRSRIVLGLCQSSLNLTLL